MPHYNRENIDRKTNKPTPGRTEGVLNDQIFNRAEQVRRDDDVIKTPKRTIYDIDYAIKWYIENEIRPQLLDNDQLIPVPVIFANGEKWDNVRRLGYLRDEKGMLQSPLIMLKRNSVVERDTYRGLDVNLPQAGNVIIHRESYNNRNKHLLDPFPPTNIANSEKFYVIDIPKYVTMEYEIMLWCDFTTQMNDLIDQILPYNRYAWGNETNRFSTSLGSISTETINTVGEDRLIRSSIPATILGTLLSEQETRVETIKKMYSVKKVSFDTVIDVGSNLFATTSVPVQLLEVRNRVLSGGSVVVSGGGGTSTINAAAMIYLTALTEKQGIRINSTTVTATGTPKINPITLTLATVNEFDIYINGQYIDKVCYTWTPTDATVTQTIIFNTTTLGYTIDVDDVIIINGRWA